MSFYSVPKIMSFQLVEIENFQENVTCPYCQLNIIDWNEEQYIQPCAHTLFIAMDLGFEYISDAYESTMLRSVDDIHFNDDQSINIFHEISQSKYTDYLVYKADLGVEGMYRYIGVSPQSI